MAAFLDNVSIQTPTKRNRSFDLSSQHLTTQTFMRPSVAYAREFFPGNDIKLNLKSYVRLAPMLKPVLGSVQVRNRVFFVPFSSIWDPFASFLAETAYSNPAGGTVIFNNVPTVNSLEIANCLTEPTYNFATNVQGSGGGVPAPGTYDFKYSTGVTGYSAYWKLTDAGRQAMKILTALGYPTDYYHVGTGGNLDMTFSFLPLLSVAKVFIDWYYPAQYAHSGEFVNIDGICQRNYLYSASARDVWSCLSVLQYVFYENDYFTSQWDNPVSPANGTYNSYIRVPDITATFNTGSSSYPPTDIVANNVDSSANGTPILQMPLAQINDVPTGANRAILSTQYGMDALKAVTNAVKRHQLVGARAIERILADYGFVMDSEKIKRSQYLGSQVFPIQFQDVMSNSDTTGAVLGDYAGKGIGFDGQGNFSYKTDNFGMFLIINSVVPDIAYTENLLRQTLHVTRLDFYNPEFDALGTQPTSMVEVFGGAASKDSIFGFAPRYAEYKVGFDRCSGDFNLPSRRTGLAGWDTIRVIGQSNPLYNVRHSLDFLSGKDAKQYLRLFYGYDGKEEIDVFYFVHRINLKVSMGASPYFDTYQFDEPEGQDIKMQANGSTLN